MILRRKLILTLGPLVGFLLIAALSSILLLHDLLANLEHISSTAIVQTTSVSGLGITMTEIEAALGDLRTEEDPHLDSLLESVERLQSEVLALEDFYVMAGEGQQCYEGIRVSIPQFVREIEELATLDPQFANQNAQNALKASIQLRHQIVALGTIALEHLNEEQTTTTTNFRWLILGIGAVFVVVLNTAILVLLRAASIVLGPINRLVAASRLIAKEEFDHRVEISQNDEFDELATAYNEMAAQLQTNDERRLEILHQVARTLRHNLNNAIEVIDLQLRLINRSSTSDRARMAKPLEEIHTTLIRMSKTVGSLSQVKQIVLTDYLEGVKMLDLEESVKPVESGDLLPTVQTSVQPSAKSPNRIATE